MFISRSMLIALGAIALVGLGACSHPGKNLPVGSYERGVVEYEGERYFDAIDDLKLFVRRNPTDPRVAEAQYHIGLARYENEEYEVAAVEFEILRNDYPNSERVEDAWYMEGMAYVEQVPDIHHDQGVALRALAHYERFLREFPTGSRHADALREMTALRLHLDRKEFEAARLYARLGRDKAALVSLDALIEERPDSELRPDALFLAATLHIERGEIAEARERLSELLADHGTHDLAPRAQELLEQYEARGVEDVE